MNKINVMILFVFLLAGAFFFKNQRNQKLNFFKKTELKNGAINEDHSYWTCPMHPQIHAAHSGECPICHMQLVKIKTPLNNTESSHEKKNRAEVDIAQAQLEMIGVERHKVEKMTLFVRVPISGRAISNNSIAFQIYESDLRYIKKGLSFTGHSTLFPEEEINGEISSVDSIVDSSSRTVRAIGIIQHAKKELILESSFRGDIILELKERVAIPESSVLHTGNGDLVYLIKEGSLTLIGKKIKIGLKSEGFYEVLEGLSIGEIISSGPNFLIDSEAKIRGASE